MDNKNEWAKTATELVEAMKGLGFPEELGIEFAKQLGSPKAMRRMIAYLYNVKPKKIELVVDEMLAICTDVAAWKEKKASEAANASYNDYLNNGLGNEE